MSSCLLPDALWAEIESFFTVPQEPAVRMGRPPKDARRVLLAILFVLKTGIAWKDLPTEAFGVSYKTCQRRLRQWTEQGIWQQIHHFFLAKLRGADGLDWSRVLVDTGHVKAPLGGEKRGRTRPIAAARAANIAC